MGIYSNDYGTGLCEIIPPHFRDDVDFIKFKKRFQDDREDFYEIFIKGSSEFEKDMRLKCVFAFFNLEGSRNLVVSLFHVVPFGTTIIIISSPIVQT
jgi:hypothetical protein